MVLSRHNITGRIPDSSDSFIINPLSGQADVLDEASASELATGIFSEPRTWTEKGYLVDQSEETRRFREAYLAFSEQQEQAEVQLFFVPWYDCNFACSYCYQEPYEPERSRLDPSVVDAFFQHVETHFGDRKKYITIFGGEPFLPGATAREAIAYLVQEAAARQIELAVVTNGYTLADYLPILRMGRFREIQVTLDGVGALHDRRRPLHGGGSTFQRVVDGVQMCLDEGLTVNLRVVLDRQNMPGLPDLARFAIERGWTALPHFKTQLGRNYELHGCQIDRSRLYDRVGMWQDVFDMARRHPDILQFHRPAFSLARFLSENGDLPDPLFDSCPGCKTEWAFDYTGRIYACTATVGKAGEELGAFYPEPALDEAAVAEWQERDVTSITECRSCPVQLACGGGCAAIARNRTGRLHGPDCRPVPELMGMGVSLYFAEGA